MYSCIYIIDTDLYVLAIYFPTHVIDENLFFYDRVRGAVGLFLIWRHSLLCIHVYEELMWCKSVCDVKSGIDPLPFWLGREQKMLSFSQVLKPIKRQNLLEEGKKWPQCRSNKGTLNVRQKAQEKYNQT